MSKENQFTFEDTKQILELRQKAEDFFWTSIPAPISERGILAGGAFSSWFHKEEPRDYDIFILNTPNNNRWYDDSKEFGVLSVERVYDEMYTKHPSNTHIRAIYKPGEIASCKKNCQYIFTKCKTREELMEKFDYWHTRVTFSRNGMGDGTFSREGTLHISSQAFEAMKKKKLVPTKYYTYKPMREAKFIDRGWTAPDLDVTDVGPIVTTIHPGTWSNVVVGTISSGGSGFTISEPALQIYDNSTGKYISVNAQSITDTQNIKAEIEALKKSLINPVPGDTTTYNEQLKKMMDVTEGMKEVKKKPSTWLDIFSEKLKKPWDQN